MLCKDESEQLVEPELNAVKNGRHSYNVEDWRLKNLNY